MRVSMELLQRHLWANLGSVLTPELARTILFESVDRAEQAIDPTRFAPVARGSLTFACESLRNILSELEPLHASHFLETERHLAGFNLAPNYEYMAERERMGTLVQFTARDRDGHLVGNLRMYIATSMHTGHLVAEEDTFYLTPSARRGRNAMNFLHYVEDQLLEVVKVAEIRANTKTVNGTDRLLAAMGYSHVANQFIKIIKR